MREATPPYHSVRPRRRMRGVALPGGEGLDAFPRGRRDAQTLADALESQESRLLGGEFFPPRSPAVRSDVKMTA
jgi:hypothetical protein